MSTIKSSSEHLTLNADGISKDIKFQANGVEKASISSAGAFTSTTIDATALTGALPAISGASLTGLTSSQMPTGSVLQVVNATNATSTANSTTTYADTSLTATITPTSTSSTILVLITQAWRKGTSDTSAMLKLLRGATDLGVFLVRPGNTGSGIDQNGVAAYNVIDSPATTSATTYKTQFASQNNAASVTINFDNDRSSITLMEIAG